MLPWTGLSEETVGRCDFCARIDVLRVHFVDNSGMANI